MNIERVYCRNRPDLDPSYEHRACTRRTTRRRACERFLSCRRSVYFTLVVAAGDVAVSVRHFLFFRRACQATGPSQRFALGARIICTMSLVDRPNYAVVDSPRDPSSFFCETCYAFGIPFLDRNVPKPPKLKRQSAARSIQHHTAEMVCANCHEVEPVVVLRWTR